ncbi:hypothetical protein D9601_17340 [Sphingomonas sp. MA1305]|uniref:hypothetical protein n=1 Tax=Sphingomonas sp. MA1305 TaxID=2479204 RepID=UPI0018DFFCC5|nr:hypothetical protein [Sphingomonas sp. MA1305]MBI0477115.1 hypothetical protein [Sphingomonas sp. MA1305]
MIEVSEPLFRLVTEGVRLHSNEVVALSSLAMLVEARRRTFLLSLRRHERATLQAHFAAVPSAGVIRIDLDLSPAAADCLAKARAWLAAELAMEASAADALSALLFDYAVERAAARMLERLEADSSSAQGGAVPGGDDSAKPIPIR